MKEVKKEVKKTNAKKVTKATPKTTTKKVAKAAPKTVTKTEKAKTTKRKSLMQRENKIKATKLSFWLTILAIFACVACAVIDASNDNYLTLPLYGIILFIIMVEDKK